MKNMLAGLCFGLIATGAVAAPVQTKADGKQAPTPQAAAAQKKAAGKRAQDAQTPLQKAQALLEKIKALEEAENASDNADERVNLLEGADKLCDAADAAAKDPAAAGKDADAASAAFGVRWGLAKRAYDLEAWAIAPGLYADIVAYEIATWGPEHPDTLEGRRLLATSLASSQRSQPWGQREYKPALDMLREVVDGWDRKLKEKLEARAEGPLDELDKAALARRDLGITLIDSGARAEGKELLGKAHRLLCDNEEHLRDAEDLWKITIDQWELLSDHEYVDLLKRSTQVVERRFPGRRDVLIALQADLANRIWQEVAVRQDRVREAVAIAEKAIEESEHLVDPSPEPFMWTLEQASFVLGNAGRVREQEHILMRALDYAKQQGITPSDARYMSVSLNLADLLAARGRVDEAMAVIKETFKGERASVGRLESMALIRVRAGDFDDALDNLTTIEASAAATRPQSAATYLSARSGKIARRAWIASIHLAAGRPRQALAMLEELQSEVQTHPGAPSDGSDVVVLEALAGIHRTVGDSAGAYALFKEALDRLIARYGAEDMRVQGGRLELSDCALNIGHVDEAETLARAARDFFVEAGIKDHANYAYACWGLAEALAAAGRLDDAQGVNEEGLRAVAALYVPESSAMAGLKACGGAIAFAKGDPKRAVLLLRDGISAMAKAPTTAARDRQTEAEYRRVLLRALAALDTPDVLHDEILALIGDFQDSIELMSVLSARERGEVVATPLRQAEQVVALRGSHPQVIEDRLLFEWFATMRAVIGPVEGVRRQDETPESTKLRELALRARQRVSAMSLEIMGPIPGPEGEKLLLDGRADCDTAERKYLKSLPPGTVLAWIDTVRLSIKLKAQDALGVSVHRIRASPPEQQEDRFLGFTLDGAGKLRVVELGPAKAIEEKIDAWRKAAIRQERGRAVPSGQPDADVIGAELRALVLDPLLQGAKQKRVYLCLDDALHTIPWDALPAAPEAAFATDGGQPAGPDSPRDTKGSGSEIKAASPAAEIRKLVGDQYRIIELASFRDVIEGSNRSQREPALLALGDIDYGAPGATAKEVPLADRPMRGRAEVFGTFDPLGFSAEEVKGIVKYFEDGQHKKAKVLTGAGATKEALFKQAKDATCLHISTHGYFAAEDVPSLGGPGQSAMRSAVVGFAPLSLCGLALAGANRDVGAREEVVGIATAEELVGLDLSHCQLAVLSGCETSLGLRRAGQDLASLKSALHAAGARNVVASLWNVPDDKTSKLMQRFYECLWKRNLPADEALWAAKSSFRDRPLVEWAGWVFSGVPQAK